MRTKTFLITTILLLAGFLTIHAQDNSDGKETEKTTENPETFDLKKGLKTGVQVAEFVILIYSNAAGRPALSQIRKTTLEVGKIKVTNSDNQIVKSEYERRILRSDNLETERVRLNQKFPNAEYALVYDGKRVFGLYNNSVFTPRDDAIKSFENGIWHGLEALLRYKENGSTVELIKIEKILGVELYVVEVTDKEKRKTTFYVSKKQLRIMMLEYEQDGVKYRRKFYDHNYAQSTLVPYRSVLWADGKIVEEKDVSTITFGQTLDESLFQGPDADTP